MHFSPTFLVFGIHGLNALNGDSHHGLVSNLARQFFVAHTGYVQVGLAAVDSRVVRRRGIAKVSLKPQISVHQFRDSVASAAGRTGIAPLMIGSITEG